MATTTPNIGLTLPVGTEQVSRQIINDNMNLIDAASKFLTTSDDVVNTTDHYMLKKIGNVVFFTSISSWSKHGLVIPQGYRPTTLTYMPAQASDNSPTYVAISTNGVMNNQRSTNDFVACGWWRL